MSNQLHHKFDPAFGFESLGAFVGGAAGAVTQVWLFARVVTHVDGEIVVPSSTTPPPPNVTTLPPAVNAEPPTLSVVEPMRIVESPLV